MQIAFRGAVVAVLATWLAACAAADSTTGTSRGTGSKSGSPASIDTSSSGTGTAGTGDLGNSTFDPSTLVSADLVDAGVQCKEGERCYDTNADPNGCGTVTLNADVEKIEMPGNVLLVFDTSGSMDQKWDNGGSKWQAAGMAIINALTPIQDLLTAGTIFFPRADPNAPLVCIDPTGITCALGIPLYAPSGTCGVTPIESTDQINFQPGAQFITAFSGPAGAQVPPYAPVPGGMTPLAEGLAQAKTALAGATQLVGTTSVIVITDGDPNCMWDEAASLQIVTDWAAAGIRTYVVGLPGTSGTGDQILTKLAQAGGTMSYITPSDPMTLQMKLQEIATSTISQGFNSCDITLDPPAEAPEKLMMIVEEAGVRQNVPHDAGTDAGWTISDDGVTVQILGKLCEDAMNGRFNSITFEFGCPDIPPPPPLPPVE